MKTMIRKLKKSGVERHAALLLLTLSGFTFSAGGTVTHINDSNTIDVVYRDLRNDEAHFTTATGNVTVFGNYAETLKLESESELVLENWMTEIESFSISTNVKEIEEHLEIENWMISNTLFLSSGIETLEEKPADVETGKSPQTKDFRTPSANFNKETNEMEAPEESKLELENWMCNNNVWNNRN